MVSTDERREILRKIILDDPNVKQNYIVEVLKNRYGIDVQQGTISKDLKAIGARYDKRTGTILFNDEIRIKDSEEKLTTLFHGSKIEDLGELKQFFIRVDEKYSQIVAYEIIEYFKLFEIEVYAFIGLDGVIQISTSKNHAKSVTELLKDILKKINKNQTPPIPPEEFQ